MSLLSFQVLVLMIVKQASKEARRWSPLSPPVVVNPSSAATTSRIVVVVREAKEYNERNRSGSVVEGDGHRSLWNSITVVARARYHSILQVGSR